MRGRPRVDPTRKSLTLHVQVTPATYDRLWGTARRAGLTIPQLLRRALEREPLSSATPLKTGGSSAQTQHHHATRSGGADGQSHRTGDENP